MPLAADPAESWLREQIRRAMRLGWAVAEVRGRLRLGVAPDQPRADWALPLAEERSAAEQLCEGRRVLQALLEECSITPAGRGGEGGAAPRFADQGERPLPGVHDPEAEEAWGHYLDRLATARVGAGDTTSTGAAGLWQKLSWAFYWLDDEIQDSLASGPFGASSGYQLGRGLAETYWALDPSAVAGDPRSWGVLLGQDRCDALCRLVDRLSFSMQAYTADAVKESLRSWSRAVEDPASRLPDPARSEPFLKELFHQERVWRDLLLTGLDPLNLLPPQRGVVTVRRIGPVLRGFLPELFILGFGVLAVSGTVALVVFGSGGNWRALTGLLGAFGLSAAAVLARVKSAAQDVTQQLRRSINSDMVREAATRLPAALMPPTRMDRVRHLRGG